MGDIVAFRLRAKSASPMHADGGERGRIIFFTGVRYERESPPQPPAAIEASPGPAPVGGARKRRRG